MQTRHGGDRVQAPAPVQERGFFAYLPALFSLPIICFDKTMK